MNDFNLNLFKYFYYVAYYNGFTKASKELKIAQPSLSYNVKTLERELNYKLINRKSRKFELTNQGDELYQTLKHSFGIMENNINLFSKNNLFEEITVGIRHSLSDFLIINTINNFTLQYPNIHLNIKLYSKLETEKFDDSYDILIDYQDYTKLIDTDNKLTIFKSKNIFICGNELFDQYKMTNSIQDLDNARLISLNPSRKKGKFHKFCFEKNISFIEILSINESLLFIEIIKNNLAIGYGCEKIFESELNKGSIKKIKIAESLPEDEIELVYKSNSKTIKNFVKVAVECLEEVRMNE